MWSTLASPSHSPTTAAFTTAPSTFAASIATPGVGLGSAPPPTVNATGSVNASGYLIDDEPESEEIGLTELQTVALACLATLIPLALGLLAVCGLRLMWRRWRWRSGDEERALRRADSSDPNRSSHLLLPDEMKTSESQFSVIPAEELDDVMSVMTVYPYSSDPGGNPPSHNHTSKSTANGSIITMTMKNNHLIVETEEPVLAYGECVGGVVSVFEDERIEVVEEEDDDEGEEVVESVGESQGENGRALVHQEEAEAGGPSTGLSQSDLSLSSANPGYCYGNQREYVTDDEDAQLQVVPSSTSAPVASRRSTPVVPFVVQPSQDVADDDDIYLEQQRQLGNGLEDRTTAPPPAAFQ